MRIDSIGGSAPLESILNEQGTALPVPEESGTKGSFSNLLEGALGEVTAAQEKAGTLVRQFAIGGNVDLHQVMIALEQASTAMNLTVQVRNRIVEAYQEVMRTPV